MNNPGLIESEEDYITDEDMPESLDPMIELGVLTLNENFFKNCEIIIRNIDVLREVFIDLDELTKEVKEFKINLNRHEFKINLNRHDLEILYDVINKIIFGKGKRLEDLINLNDFSDPNENQIHYITQLIVDENFTVNENLIKRNIVINKNIILKKNKNKYYGGTLDTLYINKEFIENNEYLNELVEKILDINTLINKLDNFYWDIYKEHLIPEYLYLSKQLNIKNQEVTYPYICIITIISYDLNKISLNLIKLIIDSINNNCETVSEIKMYNEILNNAIIKDSLKETINNLLSLPKFGILYNSAKDDFNSYL
jgi:hypothetical protein